MHPLAALAALCLLVAAAAQDPDYVAGPLVHLRHRVVRKVRPSNAPRVLCGPAGSCKPLVDKLGDSRTTVRTLRKMIRNMIVGVVKGKGKPVAKGDIRWKIKMEMEERGMLDMLEKKIEREGCDKCIKVKGVGFVEPETVLERECERLERKMSIAAKRAKVAMKKGKKAKAKKQRKTRHLLTKKKALLPCS